MKKNFLICICFLTILVLSGCTSDKRELESEWFDTFILESYYYSYNKDNGEKISGWTPIRENSSYSFGNLEQNEFFINCKTLLGSSLKFDGNIIEFDGEYKKEVVFNDLFIDGELRQTSYQKFRFKFDNIYGEQEREIQGYISSGVGNVSRDPSTNIITSRIIEINCSLEMPREGELPFNPVANFRFNFVRNYSPTK